MSIFDENSPFILAWYQRMQRQEQEEGRAASITTMTTTITPEEDLPNNIGSSEDAYVDDFSLLIVPILYPTTYEHIFLLRVNVRKAYNNNKRLQHNHRHYHQ
jgi:hypothetical protein